eukprot:9714109-Alexandrium_andersonii.AAC.1
MAANVKRNLPATYSDSLGGSPEDDYHRDQFTTELAGEEGDPPATDNQDSLGYGSDEGWPDSQLP